MAALPSGTVTFLFTDIEGSMDRWERDRHAAARAANWIANEAPGGTWCRDVRPHWLPVSWPEQRASTVGTSGTRAPEQQSGEHDRARAAPLRPGRRHWREEREDGLIRATVPRLTAPWWARCGGSPAAASATGSRSRSSPGRP